MQDPKSLGGLFEVSIKENLGLDKHNIPVVAENIAFESII